MPWSPTPAAAFPKPLTLPLRPVPPVRGEGYLLSRVCIWFWFWGLGSCKEEGEAEPRSPASTDGGPSWAQGPGYRGALPLGGGG